MAVSMGEITGQVIEKETLKPVAFAVIVFENNTDKFTVTANEQGYYYAPHVPTGKYQMRVMFNNRIFVMYKVKVYDDYTSELNFLVSKNDGLPVTVQVVNAEKVFNPIQANSRIYANGAFQQPSRDLNDVLTQPSGVDVRDGKIYIKSSDEVHFFMDGSPVAEPTPASH